MNIDAPIVPGEGAAGIQLGCPIEEILNAHKNSFSSGEVVRPSFPTLLITRYRSSMVDLWVKDGIVYQIMVHDGYRGKLMGKHSITLSLKRNNGVHDEIGRPTWGVLFIYTSITTGKIIGLRWVFS